MSDNSGARVASMFETPVIVDTLPDAQDANAQLTRTIIEQRSRSAGITVSNRGGWHSTNDMTQWGGDAGRRLLEHVIRLADQFTVDIRGGGEARFVWYPEMWANIVEQGGSHTFHYHSGCVWSAVYYVADGLESGTDEGGELVLLDPRSPGVTMTAPDLRYRRPDGKVYNSEARLKPENGRIVMFPSWLMHAVNPYRGSGQRISIAINLSALPARPA